MNEAGWSVSDGRTNDELGGGSVVVRGSVIG